MGHGQGTRRAAAYCAAMIYGGSAVLNLGESLIPGGQSLSLAPGIAAVFVVAFLLLAGPRLPLAVLFVLGPLGTALIGVAMATTTTYGDGAVLYMLPAVWTAYFFGTRGTVFVCAWTAVVHGAALIALPDAMASIDRWLDVVTAVVVVATVVRVLSVQRERLVERLAAEARVDALTGLLNRRGFDERLAAESARAERVGGGIALVSFDLDHFKRVNDEHGHEMGDRVLSWIGRLIAEQVRGVDIAARVGGEEFIVLLPGADAAGAAEFAERVRGLLGRHGPESGRASSGVGDELPLSLSGGVAAGVAPDPGELLSRADRALYAAKVGGRDRIVLDGAAESTLTTTGERSCGARSLTGRRESAQPVRPDDR